MNRDELKIGDAVEVERVVQTVPKNPELISAFWVPATVCSLTPLGVAFADGERLALHSGTRVRKPSRIISESNYAAENPQ